MRTGYIFARSSAVVGIAIAFLLARPAPAVTNYVATWASVDQHNPAPEWYQDAKFGIYFHWGVFSVPAFENEWYPRDMYNTNDPAYPHHVATYGDPFTNSPPPFWPYNYFITGGTNLAGQFVQFDPVLASQGGNFDPDAWAQLFAQAGAKFAGPVAEHHDGFAMWASHVNPWNSVSNGPQLDLASLFATAIRNQGLKFFMSMHHAYNFNGYYQYVPPQTNVMLQQLFGQLPTAQEDTLWSEQLQEIIDGYHPDVIYQDFDLSKIPETNRLSFLAYYYNSALASNQDVVATYKDGFDLSGELYDYERGGPAGITYPYWQTDDSVSSSTWCYTTGMSFYPTNALLDELIDRVSKNGNFLLNVAPMADGTIPQAEQNILLGIGDWLGRFGESIYSNRAWQVFGEGPTVLGGSTLSKTIPGTNTDIRFIRNQSSNVLYAIVMGWPGATFNITTLHSNALDLTTLTNLQLLGDSAGTYISLPTHTQDAGGLKITMPAQPYNAIAYVVKLSFSGVIPPYNYTPACNWSVPVKITTADAALNQAGAIAGAEVFGATRETVTLSSGTNITFMTNGSVATTSGSGNTSGAFSGDTGNTNFNAVLTQFEYDGGPHAITLKNLTVGQAYSVQLFALDDRTGGPSGRLANYQDWADPNNISQTFVMGDNDYVMGTFIAQETNVVIQENLPDTNSGNINALVLRSFSPAGIQITYQPESAATAPGQNAAFSVGVVAAAGNPSPVYQWQEGAVGSGVFTNVTTTGSFAGRISATTNSILSLTNLGTADVADFRVIATNISGAVTSSVATLSISGGTFSWSAPTPITTADATLNQPGIITGAEVFGPTVETVVLSNGTNITFKNDGSVATTTGSGDSTGAFSGNTGNTAFNSVLNEFEYDGGPHTITLKGLTVGHPYSVQLFALDDRTDSQESSRQANFQDPNDTNDVSATFTMGANDYVMGSFVAPSANTVIRENLFATNRGNINAVVVRSVAPGGIVVNAAPAPGGNVLLSGGGGVPGETYYVLGTTNVGLPLPDWTIMSTGSFNPGGNFRFTNAINRAGRGSFFRLELP
jgi:alpha-L-fucosidase